MLLSVDNLTISFPRPDGEISPVVENVSFHIDKGETVALVGESGSGKSLTALSIVRLLPSSAQCTGHITMIDPPLPFISHNGEETDPEPSYTDITSLNEKQLCRLRGNRISMIFQEPMTALNPLHTIGKQIREVLRLHRPLKRNDMEVRVRELLEMVGLKKLAGRLDAYPHELSGGERQRVMIAMAMACEPELLIADEPTTAVDVTIQMQLLKLLKKLQRERGLSILLITHDLTIVQKVADRVMVMCEGNIVEQAEANELFAKPIHEYTQKLLGSSPSGNPPSPPENPAIILETPGITVRYPRKKHFLGGVSEWNVAVDSIPLTIPKSTTIGVVGESGSGKTSFAMAMLRLVKSEGPIVFLGQEINGVATKDLRPLRKQLQVVFQDPYGSLNPRMTVHQIIAEGLRVHHPQLTRSERRKKTRRILEEMDLTPDMLDRYPHEFSGGQRQRIAIARAMVLDPELVVLDEPTSALDLTVQSHIIDLLCRYQSRHGTSFLFISHDLRVVRAISHQVMVVRNGKLVEYGPTTAIFDQPKQEYTRKLIKAALLEEAV